MFRRLNNIIDSISNKQKLKKYFIYDKVFQIWKQYIDKTIQTNAQPININNNVLVVKTSNPIWKTELGLQKHELLNIINSHLEKTSLIKDIKFL